MAFRRCKRLRWALLWHSRRAAEPSTWLSSFRSCLALLPPFAASRASGATAHWPRGGHNGQSPPALTGDIGSFVPDGWQVEPAGQWRALVPVSAEFPPPAGKGQSLRARGDKAESIFMDTLCAELARLALGEQPLTELQRHAAVVRNPRCDAIPAALQDTWKLLRRLFAVPGVTRRPVCAGAPPTSPNVCQVVSLLSFRGGPRAQTALGT